MRHLRRLGHSLAAGAVVGGRSRPCSCCCGRSCASRQRRCWRCSPGRAGARCGSVSAFLVVERSGLLLPAIATQRGVSVRLWAVLMTCCDVPVAGIAWWNRQQTRDLLAEHRREALGPVVVVALLLAAVAVWRGVASEPGRRPLLAVALPAVCAVAALGGVGCGDAIAAATDAPDAPRPSGGAQAPVGVLGGRRPALAAAHHRARRHAVPALAARPRRLGTTPNRAALHALRLPRHAGDGVRAGGARRPRRARLPPAVAPRRRR